MTVPAIAPLNLALALTLIREGEKLIVSGQTEAGLRVIGYGADHLQSFLQPPEPRIASELGIAANNLRRKAGAI